MTDSARPARWSAPTALLHWLGAATVIGLLGLGFAMTRFFGSAARFDLYQLHKSFGVVALALFVLRLAARAASRPPAPLDGRAWERRAASATHIGLYALMALAILAGWIAASSSPLPIPTLVFGLFTWPDIAPRGEALFAAASAAHAWLAYGLAALVALHAGAALKHWLWDRDGVMGRMRVG